ncbi:MAG: SIS domain-containing protein [Trebonia sp.]
MSTPPNGGSLAAFRLDDPELVEAGDPGGLLRQIASAAAQVRTSARASEEAGLAVSRPRAVVVAAAGASASAGEVLAAVCGIQSPVQVTVVRGHQLPGWVGAADLVIGVSSSGARQETLALAGEAVRRGCDFMGVGPARTPLADLAAAGRGFFVPVTEGPGRSQLWALTVPLLVVASRLGLLRLAPESFEETAAALEEISRQCRPASESFVNPAKSLALDIAGTLPLIWGGSGIAAVAAHRFASMLALNAKYPALSGCFPEVAYSQVAVLDGPFVPAPAPVFPEAEDFDMDLGDPDLGDTGLDDDPASGTPEPRLVLIADPEGEHLTVTRMRSAASSLAGERGIPVSELVMSGEDPFRRLASVVQMLDYTTAYFAIAGGIDPLASPARGDLRDLAGQPAPDQAVPDRPAPDWPEPDRSDGD